MHQNATESVHGCAKMLQNAPKCTPECSKRRHNAANCFQRCPKCHTFDAFWSILEHFWWKLVGFSCVLKHFAAFLRTVDTFCGFLEQNGSKIQQNNQNALIMLQNAPKCPKMQPKVFTDVPKCSPALIWHGCAKMPSRPYLTATSELPLSVITEWLEVTTGRIYDARKLW